MADIKQLLRDNIKKNSNSNQKPYAGLSQDFATTPGLKNDCSQIAINTLQNILLDAPTDSSYGLNTRLKRLDQLEAYVKAAELGSEEQSILMGMIATTRKAIKKHIQNKKELLGKAAKAIANASGDVGTLLVAMSKNDPLVRMIVGGGGAAAKMIRNSIQRRNAAKNTRRETLRQDATDLYQGTAQSDYQSQMAEQKQREIDSLATKKQAQKDAEAARKKSEKDAEAARKKSEKDAEKAKKTQEKEEDAAWKARAKQKIEEQKRQDQKDAAWKQRKKEQEQEAPDSTPAKKVVKGAAKAYETSQGQLKEVNTPLKQASTDLDVMGTSLVRIEHIMADVSSNVGDLVRLGEEERVMNKNLLFDQQEAESEKLVQASTLNNKPAGAAPEKSPGLIQKIGSMLGSGKELLSGLFAGGSLGALTGFSGVAGLAAAIVLPVLDGIAGFLKSQEWGVSRVSGFLGGMLGGSFNNKIVNVFANAGKWAVMGATLGAPLLGIGAIAGGLIGALIGGVLGYFGGEKIAKFFDSIGIMVQGMWNTVTEAFGAGFEIAKNSLTWVASQFEVLFDPIKDAITVVVDFLNNIKDKFLGWIDGITPDWAKDAAGTAWDATKKGASAVSSAVGSATDAVSSAYHYLFDIPTASASVPNRQGELERSLLNNQASPIEGFDYASYAAKVGQRESQGKYNLQNTLGFAGKYQMGSEALEDLGLLKPGSSKKGRVKSVLADANNWTVDGGLQTFLNDPKMQEDAMMKFTKKNLMQLQKLGVIKASDSPDKIAGALAGSHLGGVGNTQKYFKGQGFKDAYGTSIGEYVNLGKSSQYALNQVDTVPSKFKPNYDLVNTKSAKASQPIILVNNTQSVNNVNAGGGKGGGTSPMSSNATSGRRASQIAGSSK